MREGGKRDSVRPKKSTFLDYWRLEILVPGPVAASLIHYCTAHYVEKSNFAWRLAARYSMGGSESTGRKSTNKTVNILEFPVALTMEGSEFLTIAGAAEWLEDMQKVKIEEASGDLRKMKNSNNLMQGLILPRKVIINACIPMSTVQEYACGDADGVRVGKELRPGKGESLLNEPLKCWENKVLLAMEEVVDFGQSRGDFLLDTEPLDYRSIRAQHQVMRTVYRQLAGDNGKERSLTEGDGCCDSRGSQRRRLRGTESR